MKILKETEIKAAEEILRNGGIVAFPTETVYGLGALATNSLAAAKIFKAKGRPVDNPLIVHIANEKQLREVVKELPLDAIRLKEAFWPGPFTMILPKTDKIPKETSAGLSTIGVRMPNCRIALNLIEKVGPIAAPSANISGKPSPTSASHVIDDLENKIDAIIEGPNSFVGIESTVYDVYERMILRKGSITREAIENIIGPIKDTPGQEILVPKSPGQKYKHYSPNAKLTIIKGLKTPSSEPNTVSNVIEVNAKNLFEILRELDKFGIEHAYIKYPEDEAVLDRVLKASNYNILEV